MLIDRHIGYDDEDGQGIIGSLFQKELLYLDSLEKDRIQIWINSPGGIVADGWNIYNSILRTKTKVDTYCVGMAASIAGVIFQAGRKRIMNDYGILMYHNPFNGDEKMLDAIRESLIKMIEARSGMNLDAVEKMMKRTTWIGADEALSMGLCDSVDCSIDFNKKRSVTTAEESMNYWRESRKVLNSILPITEKIKVPNMKKVANKLALNLEASEESIIAELESREIKAKNQADEIIKLNLKVKNDADTMNEQKLSYTEMENKFKQAVEDLNKIKAENKKKEDDATAAKNLADEAAKAKAKVDAKALIAGYVATGKVKNDTAIITKWETLAEGDFDGTKELIEGSPVSKVANKIKVETVNKVEGANVQNSYAAIKMQELRAGK